MPLDLAGIFTAGVLTFASPCVLPLVPLYLGVLGGASAAELREGAPARLLPRTLAFALGLAAVFVVLGLAATQAGRLLLSHRGQLLVLSGLVMVAFGLRCLGVLRLPFADREGRPWLRRLLPGGSLLAAGVFGGAFALGWTPCIGPVLGSVLAYTALAGASPAHGALYLGTYAAGLTLPLVASAGFAPVVLRVLDRLRSYLRALEVATGLLLVGVGALLATDRLMAIAPAAGPGGETGAVASARDGGATGEACGTEGTSGIACDVPLVPTPTASLLPPAKAVHGPAVVEVMSHHCSVCRQMQPIVAEAEQGCEIRVVRAFVEEPMGAELSRSHAIRGVPTFLLLDASGGEIGRLVGRQTAAGVRGALERVAPEVCQAPLRGRAVVPD